MRRRKFFQALGGSAAALATTRGWAGTGSDNAQLAVPNFSNVPAVNPGDAEAYFTEEKLRQAIDTTPSLKGIKFEVVAYNFPSWHPSPFMEKIFGKGWTEFETLKNSRPLYPGHLFPKYPLWGYFNEAEPEWAEREIETAANFGIDVWMIDWYWHSGTMFYHEQLEDGFLKARNRSKLKFALMWANHHWNNVYPARSPREAAPLLPQLHSEDDMLKVTDYCIEHYFREPNYWRIEGRPVFAIFDLNLLLETFSRDQLKRTFERMRERSVKAGLGDLHLQASHVYGGHEAALKSLGFDSATLYHTAGWTYGGKPPGGRTPYGELALASIRAWKETATKVAVPFFPDCPVGWGTTARGSAQARTWSPSAPPTSTSACCAPRSISPPPARPSRRLSSCPRGMNGLRTTSCCPTPCLATATWRLSGGCFEGDVSVPGGRGLGREQSRRRCCLPSCATAPGAGQTSR